MEIEILQRLADENISYSIYANHDNWGMALYSKLNRTIALEMINKEKNSFEDILNLLVESILEHFPDSEFAKWWKEQQGEK
jgi:hypothetical protein